MPLADFTTPRDWIRDLDNRWPARTRLKAEIVARIALECRKYSTPSILELGIGDGELLGQLRNQCPQADLTGIDKEQDLIDYVRQQVPDCTLYCHDLTDSTWQNLLQQPADIVYSLQSFHDLGGLAALKEIYSGVHQLLVPNGLILNADFVVPQTHDSPDNPRRFPIETHHTVLHEVGFTDVQTLAVVDDMAIMVAKR